MIDINLLREDKGGNPNLVKESQRKRGKNPQDVDEIIALDKEWRKSTFELNEINKEMNKIQKLIGEKMKKKESADELLLVKKDLEAKRDKEAEAEKKAKEVLDSKLVLIGNIVHSSVIDSCDEANNEIVKLHHNEPPMKDEKLLYHYQVLNRINGYDPERGVKVAGHRGYFLRNWGVRLNQALINYGMDFLSKRNYTLLQTPFFMKREVMAKTAQLSQFDEELYKVTGEVDDSYLIATSEQPISAFHLDEWLSPSELPIRYAGYSTCFRKEAGAHGRGICDVLEFKALDTWGIFRIHQFEKVEQFVLCEPEKSWEMFDEMIAASEDFYKSLGLKYRVISIVSGALNNAAAKKYDLEAWFPRYGEYKELVSCSNCTDYQSRHLEIRYGSKKKNEREKTYVHCLNATLCATERTLSCLLENFQSENGVIVPEPLRPYLGGIDLIPYEK